MYLRVPGIRFTTDAKDKINRMGAPTWIWKFLETYYKFLVLGHESHILIANDVHGTFAVYVYETGTGPIFLEVVGNDENIVVYDAWNRSYHLTVPVEQAADLQEFIESRAIQQFKKTRISKELGIVSSCFAEGFLSLPERRRCAPGGFPLVRWKIEVSTDTLVDGMVIPIEKMRNLSWVSAYLNEGVTCEQLAKLILEWVITLRDGLTSAKVSITPERGADARGVAASWTSRTVNPRR